MKNILLILLVLSFCFTIFAQTETITNKEIILMTQAGLNNDLIIRKIKEAKGNYDTSAQSLIKLKKAGVSDNVIQLMMDGGRNTHSDRVNTNMRKLPTSNIPFYQSRLNSKPRIVLTPREALRNAKTVAINKSSLHPSRKALETQLLKRSDWRKLNINMVRYTEDADLIIEIHFVAMSLITHRYAYRIYDNKSGTVIIAGETTSWGSLSKNLARGIVKRLKKI